MPILLDPLWIGIRSTRQSVISPVSYDSSWALNQPHPVSLALALTLISQSAIRQRHQPSASLGELLCFSDFNLSLAIAVPDAVAVITGASTPFVCYPFVLQGFEGIYPSLDWELYWLLSWCLVSVILPNRDQYFCLFSSPVKRYLFIHILGVNLFRRIRLWLINQSRNQLEFSATWSWEAPGGISTVLTVS